MNINNFPMITLQPSMTDDDNDFHSDIIYFRALRHDIAELAYETKFANPFPILLSDDLNLMGDVIHMVFAAAVTDLSAVTW